MKKLTLLLCALLLVFNASGCSILMATCMGLGGGGQSSSSVERTLRGSAVEIADVNGVLARLSISAKADGIGEVYGYGYGSGYEYFSIKRDGAATLWITVVPSGKPLPKGVEEPSTNTAKSVNGTDVRYAVSRRRLEDCYSYKTQAVVACGGDRAIIRYDYSSRSPECELLGLIEALFEAKE